MSHQLARRTGTVGALVAAASMTMVAGVWPAVGMASAADVPPGQVKQDGASGTDTAPGQVKKDAEPVVGPVAEPVAEAPQADAPGQVKKDAEPVVGPVAEPVAEAPQADAPGQVKKQEGAPAPQDAAPGQVAKAAPAEEPVTTVQEPVTTVQEPTTTVQEPVTTVQEPVTTVQEPVVGPVTGVEKKNERPVKEEKVTKLVGPPTGIEPTEKAAPAAAGPDQAPRKAEVPAENAPVRGPVEQPQAETRVPVGPATGLAPETKKAPRVGPAAPQAAPKAAPKAAAPAAQRPRSAAPAKVGPVVPVAAVAPVRTSTPAASATTATASAPVDRRTLPVGPAVVRQPSRQALVAAADPLPLRPVGSDAIVLPQPVRTEVVAVDLAHALPGLAAGTAEAVARTPELPLGIAAVVVLFLLVQGRIDRRDPKLAEAPVEDNQPLEFFPARQVHLRLVAAA